MPYRTRPRYEAGVKRERPTPSPPARRWETTQVLDALNEMHNAPQEKVAREREKPHA
jgi:hypothetical protein